MRFQGKIKKWDFERAFGFISPNGSGENVFVHVSTFNSRNQKPQIGALVTYEIKLDIKNRKQAINVKFVNEKKSHRKNTNNISVMNFVKIVIIIVVFAYLFFELYKYKSTSVDSTIYKAISLRNYDSTQYSCNGKTFCSQMISCGEAIFYQEKCGASEMDGNRDGIPCEQQWCN